MSFFDVTIDDTIDTSFLLSKSTFNIQLLPTGLYKFDLKENMPPIDNFELLGSTANALATLIEYDINNYRCSRIFIYYNERLNTNSYNLYNSIKSIIEYGFCSYDNYAFNSSLLNIKPPDNIYNIALNNKYKFNFIEIKKDLNSLFLSIINNEPFIVSINIYESFNSNDEKINIPIDNEKHLGAITVIVCGFDIHKQVFIIRYLTNYYELPFFYLLNNKYSSNCFIFILRNFINININQLDNINNVDNDSNGSYNNNVNKIIDLRNNFTRVYDQGKIGSCSACALCSIFEYDDTNGFKGSRLFLYYNERLLINETDKDDGAFIKDGIKSLEIHGLCHENDWKYIIENVFTRPDDNAYLKAKQNLLINAINIKNDLQIIKDWLNKNEPITIGIAIYSNFMNYSATKTGIISIPADNDTFLGGHAVVICGYNDYKQVFILRNSWGDYWGDKGYFYLPYKYITNTDLCFELWIITKSIFT